MRVGLHPSLAEKLRGGEEDDGNRESGIDHFSLRAAFFRSKSSWFAPSRGAFSSRFSDSNPQSSSGAGGCAMKLVSGRTFCFCFLAAFASLAACLRAAAASLFRRTRSLFSARRSFPCTFLSRGLKYRYSLSAHPFVRHWPSSLSVTVMIHVQWFATERMCSLCAFSWLQAASRGVCVPLCVAWCAHSPRCP